MSGQSILSEVQLIDLTHRDAQFVRAELIDEIDKAIAAAVQVERETNAKVASAAIMHINTGTEKMREMTMADMREMCADKAYNAIMRRGEVTE